MVNKGIFRPLQKLSEPRLEFWRRGAGAIPAAGRGSQRTVGQNVLQIRHGARSEIPLPNSGLKTDSDNHWLRPPGPWPGAEAVTLSRSRAPKAMIRQHSNAKIQQLLCLPGPGGGPIGGRPRPAIMIAVPAASGLGLGAHDRHSMGRPGFGEPGRSRRKGLIYSALEIGSKF